MKTYYEVVVGGPLDLVKGFVIGFLEGKGITGETFFEEEYHVEDDSPLDFLMHLVGSKDDSSTVIVEAGLHEMLYAALNNRRKEISLEVKSIREITGAFFRFSFKTYSRETGQEVIRLFSELPEGVSMEAGYAPQEKVTSAGKGAEAYAPLHDYELKAKGGVSGAVRGVFELHRRAECFEVIELDDIELRYGKTLM